MQVQHNDNASSPKKSLFRKMREIAIRPKNYTSFHTIVSDSDSYQCGRKSMNEWTGSWKNSSSNEPILVQENESERRLREENEALKIRLNVANNTIRDLENVCKKHRDQLEGGTPPRFCSFLPKAYRDRQGHNENHDDQSHYSMAVTSHASTVQMGSAAAQKQRAGSHTNRNISETRREEAKSVKNFKKSCSNSLIFGPKLRKKLESRETMSRTEFLANVTPPCTPERTKGRSTDSKGNKFRVDESPATDAASFQIGIAHVERDSLPKEAKHKKLLTLSRLVSRPRAKAARGKGGEEQYNYVDEYPIDISRANPIYDESDESDDEYRLPVIYEGYATKSSQRERYEI